MTIKKFSAEEAKELWLSLEERPDHSLSCDCDACIFFSQPKKPRYSRRTFYIAMLVHRIKLDYLIESKKAHRVRYRGKWAWRLTPGAYEKAPFKKRLKEILLDVYGLTCDQDLPDSSNSGAIANYVKRSAASKFIRFKDDIVMARQRQWLQSKPAISRQWEKNWALLRLCQRSVDFICSRPKRQATLREIERHLHKSKVELEIAHEWLRFYPDIKRRKEGKSLIFYQKAKNIDGIFDVLERKNLRKPRNQ